MHDFFSLLRFSAYTFPVWNSFTDRLRDSDQLDRELPSANRPQTNEELVRGQAAVSVTATPMAGLSDPGLFSVSGESAQRANSTPAVVNEATPNSVYQLTTPSAPVAQRTALPLSAPSPFGEDTLDLAATSPSELAVDIASAILSQLTTASTAAVTSNAAVSNSVGRFDAFHMISWLSHMPHMSHGCLKFSFSVPHFNFIFTFHIHA